MSYSTNYNLESRAKHKIRIPPSLFYDKSYSTSFILFFTLVQTPIGYISYMPLARVGLLKRLKKLTGDEQPKEDYQVYGEYAENMDDAYRHGGYDKEEEENAKEIRRVLRSDNPPMSKATAAEKLARLEELRNMRIITEVEFERIRQEIRGNTNAKQEKM